jgi:signal transduction histidine kinase
MINDLSTLSRAERGVGDEIEEININRLLHDLFEKYTPQMQEKSLSLDLDVESNLPEIKTSRLYLEEILENFLTNALKYTKTGSVTIGARLNKETGLRLWVKDSGIGMSKSDLEHIFEKFYRSEDYRTREIGGTGLGLYVVSKLAAKLNTRIEVESRLNHGSTFAFTLTLPNRENEQTIG